MAKKDTAPPMPPTYEEAYARLEALIESLENGETPLAELVEKFTQGHHLLKICQDHLRAAELKIEQLKLDDPAQPRFAPFAGESEA